MRLHHLQITAFGPFAGVVDVDFDDLSQAGLFLMSGATGSGKTSVLDAVSFALYGAVPGERNSAKRLRSDHAAAHVRPEVTLETTLAGRRFRITRTPPWERPKKRGTGLTSEQTSVSLSEQVDGRWEHLSSRADETGQLIGDLLGMNLTQFTQVALLPQGQFQAFLRATSEERHRLLQRLFRTGRFEQVESWLRQHRLDLRRDATQAHHQVAEVVSRISEAVVGPLPDDWDLGDLSVPATDGSLESWLHEHYRDIGSRLLAARSELEQAGAVETQSQVRVAQAQALCTRRERIAQAAQDRTLLEEQSVDHLYRRDKLNLARRATALADVLELSAAAQERSETAQAEGYESIIAARDSGLGLTADSEVPREDEQLALEWDEPAAAGREPFADPVALLWRDPASLATSIEVAVAGAVERAAELRALLPLCARRRVIDAETARLGLRRTGIVKAHQTLAERAAVMGREVEQDQARLSSTREVGARVETLQAALDECGERLAAFGEATALLVDLQNATGAHVEAVNQAQDLRENWLRLKEVRLEGMASEIAVQLAVGACCPVCGSAEHPNKARRDAHTPDADQEKTAFRVMEDAKAEAHVRDGTVRDLDTRMALIRQRTGTATEADTVARHSFLHVELDAAQTAALDVSALETRLASLQASRSEVEKASMARTRELADVDAGLAALGAEARRIDADLAPALGETSVADLDDVIARAQEQINAGRRAAEALAAIQNARAVADEAGTRLSAALLRSRFESSAHARSALLPEAEVDALDEAIRHHDARLTAVVQILAEPGAEDILRTPAPDVEALMNDHELAQSAAEARREAVSLLSARAERLRDLTEDLAERHATWRPLHQQLTVASALSSFIEGKASDNRWHMRLSAYVLAYRLTQVVEAANERLTGMSDQRYSLVHTGQRGAGEKRGGLSLLIRDDWTGETRDPATLSGGETFVVSLALALGLADVISDEAGGARLDTLFVDEGFGSLDAETLDGVMDTLDSLRDGGRVVGVVSHVSEMRDRIPTQLVLRKSRSGSTLEVRS